MEIQNNIKNLQKAIKELSIFLKPEALRAVVLDTLDEYRTEEPLNAKILHIDKPKPEPKYKKLDRNRKRCKYCGDANLELEKTKCCKKLLCSDCSDEYDHCPICNPDYESD